MWFITSKLSCSLGCLLYNFSKGVPEETDPMLGYMVKYFNEIKLLQFISYFSRVSMYISFTTFLAIVAIKSCIKKLWHYFIQISQKYLIIFICFLHKAYKFFIKLIYPQIHLTKKHKNFYNFDPEQKDLITLNPDSHMKYHDSASHNSCIVNVEEEEF